MLWKASHNAIPTLCNLWKRNVVNSVMCSGCRARSEDTIHALWSCPALYVLWEGNEFLKRMFKYKFECFADLLGMAFMMKERIDTNLLTMIFWLIWRKLNSNKCGEMFVEITNIRSRANSLRQEFIVAQNLQAQVPTTSTRVVRWIPPNSPHCKINFDGACFVIVGATGLGAMMRDSSSKVLGALAQNIILPSSAAAVKELACCKAMLFAKEQGFEDFIFERDADAIIKAIVSLD